MNQNQLEYLNEIDRPKSRVLLVWESGVSAALTFLTNSEVMLILKLMVPKLYSQNHHLSVIRSSAELERVSSQVWVLLNEQE